MCEIILKQHTMKTQCLHDVEDISAVGLRHGPRANIHLDFVST